MKKVCHITTVHPRYDTRIFEKECRFLSNQYEVHLIVADGKGDEFCEGTHIHDVGKSKNRFWRMLNAAKRAFKKAISVDADLYHIHDLELLPIAKKLKNCGKKVIFDAHEPYPEVLSVIPFLNTNIVKKLITKHIIMPLVGCYQKSVFQMLDGLVAANQYILEGIKNLNHKTILFGNYFDISQTFSVSENALKITNSPDTCYLIYGGCIDKIYGITEVVKSLKFVNHKVVLRLAGCFSSEDYRIFLESLPEWKHVDFYGAVLQNQLFDLYKKSNIGVVPLLDVDVLRFGVPRKFFEFMYFGLPVIVSESSALAPIVKEVNCGLLVKQNSPDTPQQIAKCIDYLIEHPAEAKRMGENGTKAIFDHYNMNESYEALAKLYREIIG